LALAHICTRVTFCRFCLSQQNPLTGIFVLVIARSVEKQSRWAVSGTGVKLSIASKQKRRPKRPAFLLIQMESQNAQIRAENFGKYFPRNELSESFDLDKWRLLR
jgi:hypothetical protein